MGTADDDPTEIAAMRTEIDRMRAATAVTLTGMFRAPVADTTVAGTEELVLQVSSDRTVSYMNQPMAVLLGIPNREWAVGNPIAQYDIEPLGPHTLASLIALARESQSPQVQERPFPGVRPERLPGDVESRPAISPILRISVTVSDEKATVVIHDVTRLRWLEAMFARYVSPKVIEEMQGVPSKDFLRMQRKELTILFADLRGFTAMGESLPPEAVGELVGAFLGNMVGVINAAGGTIDKFVGDEVMAIFGAPIETESHALRAISCAINMQREHAKWMKARADDNLPQLPMGVGLATGEVVVGNVGTPSRMDYTVLGHAVNLAARLCGSAEGGEILTTRVTYESSMAAVKKHTGHAQIRLPGLRSRGPMSFKNVAHPIEVIAIVP